MEPGRVEKGGRGVDDQPKGLGRADDNREEGAGGKSDRAGQGRGEGGKTGLVQSQIGPERAKSGSGRSG